MSWMQTLVALFLAGNFWLAGYLTGRRRSENRHKQELRRQAMMRHPSYQGPRLVKGEG